MSHYEINKAYHEMKKGHIKSFIPTQKKKPRFGTILACGNFTPKISTMLAGKNVPTTRVGEAKIGECKIN